MNDMEQYKAAPSPQELGHLARIENLQKNIILTKQLLIEKQQQKDMQAITDCEEIIEFCLKQIDSTKHLIVLQRRLH